MFHVRHTFGFIALGLFFPFFVSSGTAEETQDDLPWQVETVQFVIQDQGPLLMDLYRPEETSSVGSASSLPVVVFVHGGGWKNGSRKSAKKMAAWLAEEGFAVASIDYRLTDVAGWPAQIDDCYAAVRWLRDNAGQYGLDPERIGAWGTSAGGHLAALMGTRVDPHEETRSKTKTPSSRVQAVCDWFGPSDLLTMPPNQIGNGRTAQDVANSNGAKLLRATVGEVPELARDASSLHHVNRESAKFLIMHGDEDPGVPLAQSKRLHEALVNVGVRSNLNVIKGAGHGGPLFQTAAARQKVLRFFEQTLKPVWPSGAGPNANFSLTNLGDCNPPTSWSVVRDEGIVWKKTLPETGQSTVTIWEDRIFFTTMSEVDADSSLGANVVAWCCDASSGKTIWKRDVIGKHPLRLSGCFSDSSSPPPVADGKRVCFFNASGRISCFDFDGKPLWTNEIMPVGRSQPFIIDDHIVFTRQSYMPDAGGHFTHEYKDAGIDLWTQLQALDIQTGEVAWTSRCGVNMGCVPLPHALADGRRVIFVGRGGGHSPPEKPEGISMIDANDGQLIWTLPLDGFMSTMAFHLAGNHVLVFHDDEHLWVNVETGTIERRTSFLDNVRVRVRKNGVWATQVRSLPKPKKKRAIIQQSNVVAGRHHYFRSYSMPYLGRVDIDTGAVEYLQLPVQLKRTVDDPNDHLLWDASGIPKETLEFWNASNRKPSKVVPIEKWCFEPNDMKNSRGRVVMGDQRSRGTGWGHHASQLPTVIGSHLYVPVMNGTVYVLDAHAEILDEDALIAINDLGPVGRSYNRASLSYSSGRLFAHTIRELVCVEGE